MIKNYPQFSFGFAIIAFAELFAIVNGFNELRYFTKSAICISLIIFIIFSVKHKGRFTKRVIGGLFFSLLGDVFLMLPTHVDTFFIFGMVAFLIAHLFYILAFYVDASNEVKVEHRNVLAVFLVYMAFCISVFLYLRPYLGALKIPIMVYCFVITMMGIMAALRYGKTNFKSFKWICWGSVLFIISDTVLAYNKFVAQVDYAPLVIMVTYMGAQFLITTGTVERKYVKKN